MLENGWLLDLEREDARLAEADKHNHWGNDRDRDNVEDYVYERDLMAAIIAERLGVDVNAIDWDFAVYLFENSSAEDRYNWAVAHIDGNYDREADFDRWYEER